MIRGKIHLSPEHEDDDNINIAIHFNLPNHSIDDMEISALLFTPTENYLEKPWRKNSSSSLE